MKAYQIMDDSTEWRMWHNTAWNCDIAIYYVTDYADYWESVVLCEGALNARDFMQEVMT